jgi:hypothetical protein
LDESPRDSQIAWRHDKSTFENDLLTTKSFNIILPKIQEIAGKFDVTENLASAKQNMDEAGNMVSFLHKTISIAETLEESSTFPI